MDDYKQLCIELINELNGYKVAHPQHDTELIDRARAVLAEPEPEGPTDEELLEAVRAGVDSFPPRHPEALNLSVVEYQVELEIRKARAVLARWGNSSAPQPIPVSERWPEFYFDDADYVWCWNWRVGAWRLSHIDRSIHSHWLPAHALPLPEEVV